ncbi:hypothetical protein NSZ01_23350 [Nocardioides szechwanensis]|nr:hypothetical protein NSZ01_23350 [Nocardioides szechwanensis]
MNCLHLGRFANNAVDLTHLVCQIHRVVSAAALPSDQARAFVGGAAKPWPHPAAETACVT